MNPKKDILALKNEYHRIIDENVSRINENLRNLFKYAKIHDKWENEKPANIQIKTSGLIIMQSVQDLFLLLQKFKHHRTRSLLLLPKSKKNLGLLYDIEEVDKAGKERKAGEKTKLRDEVAELKEVGKQASDLAEEIENFLYRLKPDHLLIQESRHHPPQPH